MKVEMAVLGSQSLIVLTVSVEVKQRCTRTAAAYSFGCRPYPQLARVRLQSFCSRILNTQLFSKVDFNVSNVQGY